MKIKFFSKKISSKHQNEENMESAYSDFFQPSYNANHKVNPYSTPYRQCIAPSVPVYREEGHPNLFDTPQLAKYPSGSLSLKQFPTPDTALPSDSLSNVDSYLNVETNDIGTTDFSVVNGAQDDSAFGSPSSNDDFTYLGKRKFYEDDMACSSFDYSMNYEEPTKLPCYGVYQDVEEQKLSMPHFDYPLFFETQEDRF